MLQDFLIYVWSFFSLKLMLNYPKESLFKFKAFEILRNIYLHFVPAFISYYLSCSKLLKTVYYFLSDGLKQVGDFRHILWHWGFSTAQNSAKTPGTICLFFSFFWRTHDKLSHIWIWKKLYYWIKINPRVPSHLNEKYGSSQAVG